MCVRWVKEDMDHVLLHCRVVSCLWWKILCCFGAYISGDGRYYERNVVQLGTMEDGGEDARHIEVLH